MEKRREGDDRLMSMPALEFFCRTIRARSAEHSLAMELLHRAQLPIPMVAILRQELDSMVRVIYLLSIDDRAVRATLVGASVNGQIWRGPDGKRITDRQMVNLARRLHGWAESVYQFGCAFIHLSHLHDHQARDPMRGLRAGERSALLRFLRGYHDGPLAPDAEVRFVHLLPYLPRVFSKIASNLECYVKQLEADEGLD